MKPTLAQPYAGQSPAGYLISEKLDGIRAIWNGSAFISRNGNAFKPPAAFLAAMPEIPLDGELYIGRGQFQATMSAVKSTDWRGITFRVFDCLADPAAPFHGRLFMAEMECEGSPVCQFVPHLECAGPAHLESVLAEIIAGGGEGVILRDPHAPYHAGKRTPAVLKYKPWADDEGTLTGTEPGDGQFAGQVGALLIAWHGLVVRLGSGLTHAIRRTPPPIGAPVTFKFAGRTDSGQPRFASFVAIRDYEP